MSGELLGNGAAAGEVLARKHVPDRPQGAAEAETVMIEEILVFPSDEGIETRWRGTSSIETISRFSSEKNSVMSLSFWSKIWEGRAGWYSPMFSRF